MCLCSLLHVVNLILYELKFIIFQIIIFIACYRKGQLGSTNILFPQMCLFDFYINTNTTPKFYLLSQATTSTVKIMNAYIVRYFKLVFISLKLLQYL